ncbi:unnamed protein product, partial [Prorocentrum cordatum]
MQGGVAERPSSLTSCKVALFAVGIAYYCFRLIWAYFSSSSNGNGNGNGNGDAAPRRSRLAAAGGQNGAASGTDSEPAAAAEAQQGTSYRDRRSADQRSRTPPSNGGAALGTPRSGGEDGAATPAAPGKRSTYRDRRVGNSREHGASARQAGASESEGRSDTLGDPVSAPGVDDAAASRAGSRGPSYRSRRQ